MNNLCQRWRDGRDSYRPAGEPIRTSHYDVAAIDEDRVAKAFVLQHHYSGSFPAARFRYGLHGPGGLEGVAVFSVPVNSATITNAFPCDPLEGVELGRFVLLDHVPANAESWMIARCFELLRREGVRGVVSHSDPLPRDTSRGARVFPGHVGTIYQATNAVYAGRARARPLQLLPDGRVLNERSIAKLYAASRGDLTKGRGWRAVCEILRRHGADEAPEGPMLKLWADHWIGRLTRRVRHKGNHRYLWALDRRLRRHLPEPRPYPKQVDSEIA
jgi:hypothetical protein